MANIGTWCQRVQRYQKWSCIVKVNKKVNIKLLPLYQLLKKEHDFLCTLIWLQGIHNYTLVQMFLYTNQIINNLSIDSGKKQWFRKTWRYCKDKWFKINWNLSKSIQPTRLLKENIDTASASSINRSSNFIARKNWIKRDDKNQIIARIIAIARSYPQRTLKIWLVISWYTVYYYKKRI